MKRAVLAIGVVFVIALTAAVLLFLGLQKEITLVVDGSRRQVKTRASTVADLLSQEEIPLGARDSLSPEAGASLSPGMTIQLDTARPVVVWADGFGQRLVSPDRNVADLLDQADVEASARDQILFRGQETSLQAELPPAPFYTLQVLRSVPIEITDRAKQEIIYSTRPTLGEALWEAGRHLHEADHLSHALDTPLTEALEVNLTRAVPIEVRQGSSEFDGFTTAATVGEALTEAGLALQGLDYTRPAEDAPLPVNGQIEVVRVEETTQIEKELLPFESEVGPDPEMLIDTRGVSQPGAYGVDATRIRIRSENGEEIWRQVEDQWVALEPQPMVMGYGTKIEIKTIDTPQGELEYWRAVPMYATSYSPCRIFADRCDSVTSSGATLRHGVAAVTLRHYRVMAGSQVYVPGYGVATILDVGGGIPGRNWIDLGYSDDNYVSWHDWVTVYFLTPVPPEGLIIYDMN